MMTTLLLTIRLDASYLVVRVCLYAMVAVAGVVPAVHSYFLLHDHFLESMPFKSASYPFSEAHPDVFLFRRWPNRIVLRSVSPTIHHVCSVRCGCVAASMSMTLYKWVNCSFHHQRPGVFFYISQFPESRWPGKFDIWVCSSLLAPPCASCAHTRPFSWTAINGGISWWFVARWCTGATAWSSTTTICSSARSVNT